MAPASDPEAPTTGYETIGADTRDVVAGCKTIVMRLYRDRAVVLRQHKLGEADRIVTLLTRDHGLVRAVAKGVRRTRSKFGARLEPFAHIEVQLHPGRNLDIVTQVVSVDAFATDIVADYGPLHLRMRDTGNRRTPGVEDWAPLRFCTA
ncbi:DNA repair protein recO, partial [Mycobacterium tuberculosis T92]